jgi:hypothetical protein
MSTPHVVDITPYADTNEPCRWRGRKYEFRKITSGRRAVNDSDAITKLKLGYDVKFSAPDRDSVKSQFSYGVIEVLIGEFGENILDQVDFNWWNSKNHIKGFQRRQAKNRVKSMQPVWSNPFPFFVPQISNQFRVEQDWKLDLENCWWHRPLIIPVYGKKAFEDDTYNGLKVGNREKITDVFALSGTMFKVSKMNFNKTGGSICIAFEKGSAFNVDGQRVVLDKQMDFYPHMNEFNKLTCSINELSKETV